MDIFPRPNKMHEEEKRKSVPGFILLLLLCLTDVGVGDTSCSSKNGETLMFSVRSRRNESLHRIVSVDLERDLGRPDARNITADVELDVFHSRYQCDGKDKIFLSTTAAVVELLLREDYEIFPGLGRYKLHTKALSWEEARSTCVREGGHLIVINSEAEANVVKQFFARKPQFQGTSSSSYVYVGIHDSLKEGEYTAVTGELLSGTGYSRWASGQPDGSSTQNYVVAEADGSLRDIANTDKHGFICELAYC